MLCLFACLCRLFVMQPHVVVCGKPSPAYAEKIAAAQVALQEQRVCTQQRHRFAYCVVFSS